MVLAHAEPLTGDYRNRDQVLHVRNTLFGDIKLAPNKRPWSYDWEDGLINEK